MFNDTKVVESAIYSGTERTVSIYVPNLEDSGYSDEYKLMVFQDGDGYLNREGPIRATKVLDTLIHNREIGPTIGLFVNPGVPVGALAGADDRQILAQRSIEYDTCNGQYSDSLSSGYPFYGVRDLDCQYLKTRKVE